MVKLNEDNWIKFASKLEAELHAIYKKRKDLTFEELEELEENGERNRFGNNFFYDWYLQRPNFQIGYHGRAFYLTGGFSENPGKELPDTEVLLMVNRYGQIDYIDTEQPDEFYKVVERAIKEFEGLNEPDEEVIIADADQPNKMN